MLLQRADSVPITSIPEAARIVPGRPFDAAAATRAYLATVPPGLRARSDAYTEGGYWLQLAGSLLTVAILVALLHTGFARRFRELAERLLRWRPAATFLTAGLFTVAVTVLGFPFSWYVGFVREHAYGLATQRFGGWLRDQAVALGVSLVLGGVAAAAVYAVLRRFPRRWPVLGAGVALAFLVVTVLIEPVFIAPLFNRYTLLSDPVIRDPILRLAHANGIAGDRVYVVDASRQSTRISANVSGLLGTERITLNDNLLRRTSLPGIEAVMGHEMGHYVLHHVVQLLLFLGLVIVTGFFVLQVGAAWALTRWGERWGVRDMADPAGLPLLALVFTLYLLVLTPVINGYVRSTEAAADIFGLNTARQPDAFALVALRLAEYRKLDPGPWEEWFWYDHPSGRARIRMAMEWKGAMEAVGTDDRSGIAPSR